MSLKDEILSLREKYAPTPVPVEVDGRTVYIHALTMADRVDFDARAHGDRLVLVVLRATRDAEGRRVFNEGEVDLVRTLPDEFTLPVWEAATKLSGMAPAREEAVAAAEEGKANGSPNSAASSSG